MTDLTPEERANAERLDSNLPDFGHGLIKTFDKDGTPITFGEFTVLAARGYGASNWYSRVAQDIVGRFEVSTVWLGMEHGHWAPPGYDGPIAIFETMIFSLDDDEMRDREFTEVMERYPDMGSALLGHANIVEAISTDPAQFIAALRADRE